MYFSLRSSEAVGDIGGQAWEYPREEPGNGEGVLWSQVECLRVTAEADGVAQFLAQESHASGRLSGKKKKKGNTEEESSI